MTRYTITFYTGNSTLSFDDTVDSLLQQAANKIKHESGLEYELRDAHGNQAGTVRRKFLKK